MFRLDAPVRFADMVDHRHDGSGLVQRPSRAVSVTADKATASPYSQLIVKRVLDLLICAAALIFFAPLMLIIAGAIRMTGPVFFKQERIGQGGRLFKVYKFRTMAVDAEQRLADLLANDRAAQIEWEAMRKLTKDPRITAVGRFLRLSSLDELPQLINVVVGDMSVVGPRPIIPGEAVMYDRYIADYCRVKPGLTGLWQVSGRNGTTYRRRVALDVYYSRHASLALDIKILFKTIPAVLRAEGAH
ncbi:MAG: sugar transferase [Azonexus sp.]|nr:sugar transferase [Azonexus sp.]